MKICIWCKKNENETTFNQLAHSIPKSLGGKNICECVCDECNHYFGKHYYGYPPIETVIKETFNISRSRLLATQNEIGKNKSLAKFSSIYFNVDWKKRHLTLRKSYKYNQSFQEKVGVQLKKGIYKMFLEETERQKGIGLLPQYDFIREFCRYNIGDYPIFYFERAIGIILFSMDWVKSPELILNEELQMKYLISEPGFKEFEFLGHVFGIATSRNWEINFVNYMRKSKEKKKGHFKKWKSVKRFSDIDLALSILDDKK